MQKKLRKQLECNWKTIYVILGPCQRLTTSCIQKKSYFRRLTVSSAVVEERLVPGGARQDAGIWEGCAEKEKKGEG